MDRARCSRPTGTSRRHKDDDSSLDDGEGSSSGTAGTALISRVHASAGRARLLAGQLPAIYSTKYGCIYVICCQYD